MTRRPRPLLAATLPAWIASWLVIAGCGRTGLSELGAGAGSGGPDGASVGVVPGTTPAPVVSKQWDVVDIVVREGRLDWTTGFGEVHGCVLPFCNPVTTYAGYPDPWAMENASGLVADAANVYWANGVPGSVLACPIAGCGPSPTTIVAQLNSPGSLAIDDTDIYVSAYNDSAIYRCPKAGCVGAPTVMALGQQSPTALAVDATHLYWVESVSSGTVKRVAKNTPGAAPEVIASAQNQPASLALSGGRVFWSTNWALGSVLDCPVEGCPANGPHEIASSQHNPMSLAADDTHVYWIDGQSGSGTGPLADGVILRCGFDGCGTTPTVLAQNQMVPTYATHALALDDAAVYWAITGGNDGVADGVVMGLAK